MFFSKKDLLPPDNHMHPTHALPDIKIFPEFLICDPRHLQSSTHLRMLFERVLISKLLRMLIGIHSVLVSLRYRPVQLDAHSRADKSA